MTNTSLNLVVKVSKPEALVLGVRSTFLSIAVGTLLQIRSSSLCCRCGLKLGLYSTAWPVNSKTKKKLSPYLNASEPYIVKG